MSSGKPWLRRGLLGGGLLVAAWLAMFGDKTPPGVVAPRASPDAAPSPGRADRDRVNAMSVAVNGGGTTGAASAPPTPARAGVARGAASTPAIEALAVRTDWYAAVTPPQADLFARAPWHVPPPAPPPPPAPVQEVAAPAAAPPLPYRVIGKQQEAQQWEVFLVRDEQSFVVRSGQVLEGVWRVDRIAPPTMVLTHLPSGQAQQLSIGEAL